MKLEGVRIQDAGALEGFKGALEVTAAHMIAGGQSVTPHKPHSTARNQLRGRKVRQRRHEVSLAWLQILARLRISKERTAVVDGPFAPLARRSGSLLPVPTHYPPGGGVCGVVAAMKACIIANGTSYETENQGAGPSLANDLPTFLLQSGTVRSLMLRQCCALPTQSRLPCRLSTRGVALISRLEAGT